MHLDSLWSAAARVETCLRGMAHAQAGRRNTAAEAVVTPAPAPAVVMIVCLASPVPSDRARQRGRG